MIGSPGPENLNTLRAVEQRLTRNRRPQDLGVLSRLGATLAALKKRRFNKSVSESNTH